MYIKNFHQRYAKCVHTFCQSVPSVLQVTTEEIDTYFRSCALYLWTHSANPGDIARGINRLYTDSKVRFTYEEVEEQISFYQSNPGETIGVPDFFLRMLVFDIDSDTNNSRRFTEAQIEILKMCAEGILYSSSLDQRRIEWLNEQLVIICDQAEIGEDGSRGEKEPINQIPDKEMEELYETMAEVDALFQSIRKMNEQIQENDKSVEGELTTGKEG